MELLKTIAAEFVVNLTLPSFKEDLLLCSESFGYGLAQSSGGHIFPVVVVSKSLLEVNTVAKKFPDTVQLVVASWIGRAANENVLDSARVEKSSCCAARFWKRSSSG